MVATTTTTAATGYDRTSELKLFDNTKAGVKGVLDTGIDKLPQIFVKEKPQPLDHLPVATTEEASQFTTPIVDLEGLASGDPSLRKEIVDRITAAFEEWGYFQVVNHGIPVEMLEAIREATRRFHEQATEEKMKYYSREYTTNKQKFIFSSNFYLYEGPVTNWRDTFSVVMKPGPIDPEILPPICRDVIMEYSEALVSLGETMFELFSEAMGLSPTHLKEMDCTEEMMLLGHYYPPCPEPEKAIGINNHKDNDFMTILLQDQFGGLEVLHDNKWVEVPFVPDALVINTGDLLQLVSNCKLNSVIHRVQCKKEGPRISVAGFFRPLVQNPRPLGPIKELLSEENPAVYREATIKEYLQSYKATGRAGWHPCPRPFQNLRKCFKIRSIHSTRLYAYMLC